MGKKMCVFPCILVCNKILLAALAGFLEDPGSHQPQEDQGVLGDPKTRGRKKHQQLCLLLWGANYLLKTESNYAYDTIFI